MVWTCFFGFTRGQAVHDVGVAQTDRPITSIIEQTVFAGGESVRGRVINANEGAKT